MMEATSIEDTPYLKQRRQLEALIIGNADLQELEERLARFNIFEVLDAVRRERHHSAFLAFLLDPQQRHGWDDAFLKRLLQEVLIEDRSGQSLAPIDIEVMDFDQLVVYRERHNIDIFLLDERNRLVVIIENKIDSSEHSGQLQRYRQEVQKTYRGFRILAVYLTPDGDAPSDETYAHMSYTTVCTLIETLVEARASSLGPDVLTLVRHYTEVLRRHIVTESDIAKLCKSIYRQHKAALDLIYEHRPDRQSMLHEFLKGLIAGRADLELAPSHKGWIRFAPKAWQAAWLHTGNGWARSDRLVLFEFVNALNSLTLDLTLAPGDAAARQQALDFAQRHQPPFGVITQSLGDKYPRLYRHTILSTADYEDEDLTDDDLTAKIRKQWDTLLGGDIQQITDLLANPLPPDPGFREAL